MKYPLLTVLCALACAGAPLPGKSDGRPEGVPGDLQPIGGKWYVQAGPPRVYYFRDGARYVDLFSYHARDSNRDGIDNVRLSHDSRSLIVESQGYPNHPTALFPNSGNPNSILVQKFHFQFPLQPTLSDTITRLPMGPIGMALNGVVFFNPFEAGGMNAVEGYSEVWLDACCGHPQQHGVYHYHKFPACVKSPFPDDGKQHSPVIGFAFDGFPIYGPYEEAGVMARDLKNERSLDVCNGHSDGVRGYHYHVTPGRFPYVVGGYAGVPEFSNSHGLRGAGTGAIQNNAEGKSQIGRDILAVRPGTASRGKKHSVRIELAPQGGRRGGRPGAPSDKPRWVQIGPYEATRIGRTGNVVTIDIDIPADASLGMLLDCHLEFPARPGQNSLVFKKNDVFRVVD